CGAVPYARQKDCGRPNCGPTSTPTPRGPRTTRPPAGPKYTPTPAPPPCDEPSEILVRCSLPGCSVSVDGKVRGLTNDRGELLVEGLPHGAHTVAISKQGYEGDSRVLTPACGANATADL